MTMQSVKRMAADILGVGELKIRFHTDHLPRIKEALTRQDVRERIAEGIIYAMPKIGVKKKEKTRRKKGRIRGFSAGLAKRTWMGRVRSQRKYLVELLSSGRLDKKSKRSIYMKIKSGIFRNKHAMLAYLEENHLVKKQERKEEKS